MILKKTNKDNKISKCVSKYIEKDIPVKGGFSDDCVFYGVKLNTRTDNDFPVVLGAYINNNNECEISYQGNSKKYCLLSILQHEFTSENFDIRDTDGNKIEEENIVFDIIKQEVHNELIKLSFNVGELEFDSLVLVNSLLVKPHIICPVSTSSF